MAYDEEFFKQYREYLSEVKDEHLGILESIIKFISSQPRNIVDLGAGIDGEFKELYRYFFRSYLHDDENDEPAFDYYRVDNSDYPQEPGIIKINYRNTDSTISLIQALKCDCFVSLFSSEITSNYKDNYLLYNEIFKNAPTINFGIVSGFYYGDKLEQNPVKETGDIVSYQTLEKASQVKSDLFDEIRIEKHVPSKMFGQNVFEVWKLFRRK